MATATALVFQGLSLLLQWLGYRKQRKRPLSDRESRMLGHLAARLQNTVQAVMDLGVTPKLDEDAYFDSIH